MSASLQHIPSHAQTANPSQNTPIGELCTPSRREWLGGAGGMALLSMLGGLSACASAPEAQAVAATAKPSGPLLGFKRIPIDATDSIKVPEGYVARALTAWGDPVGISGNMPAFKWDGSNTAEEQAAQQGMHHDGMHYFALDGSKRGLLVTNHEYVDDGLLHADGAVPWTAAKVRKAQAAHGFSVVEIAQGANGWQPVRPSAYARRVTANTQHRIAGPCAGHAMMRTAADPEGRTVLGTLGNCASGITPWGTYLSGEENWHDNFAGGQKPTPEQRRYNITPEGWWRWAQHDKRFDATVNPNEFNRFGWVVELDPMDPSSPPVKRTALGRAAREGAVVAVTADKRAVVYSGEDAHGEYIYKFVSRDQIKPAGNGLTAAQANRDLLDHGTLYVARFNADGSGDWLPLVHGQGPLTATNKFADQGEVLVKARFASDALGGTPMDRPEWVAVSQDRREVYCTLTNSSRRGTPEGKPVDAANPRANNTMGSIIRWREGPTDGGDFDALKFRWNHLVLAGDPSNERAEAKGNTVGDTFAAPDGLMFDARGLLWVQTDMSARNLNAGEYKHAGNNSMLACDVRTGEFRRFLSGPMNCEITGLTFTPDMKTMFLNVQHPGETPSERSDPANPRRFSNWPDFRPDGRPRSGTVVVQRVDGGVIGAA